MHFIIMPDTLSAAFVRQKLAQQQLLGVQVGTFTGLMEQLLAGWLLQAVEDDFTVQLRKAAMNMPDAFWAGSLQVNERATLKQLQQSLGIMLDCLPPAERFSKIASPVRRAEHYYNDLVALHENMGGSRPLQQQQAEAWLASSGQACIQPVVPVFLPELLGSYCACRQAVLQRLQNLFPRDQRALGLAKQLREWLLPPVGQLPGIKALSESIFNAAGMAESARQYVRFDVCRDDLEQAEVLAGMVKKALDEGIQVNEMAVVVPQGSRLQRLLPEVLVKSGILCSNQSISQRLFQWDVQLIRDLLCLYQAVNSGQWIDPMLMGAVLVNPLMPWRAARAQALFDHFSQGKTMTLEAGSDKQRRLLDLLQQTSVDDVFSWLNQIGDCLAYSFELPMLGKEQFSDQLQQMADSMDVYSHLPEAQCLERLLLQLQPGYYHAEQYERVLYSNGLLVITDQEYLMQPVRHLLVTGFNQGEYQPHTEMPGVFAEDGWRIVSSKTGLPCYQRLTDHQVFYTRFRMLLGRASESISFLLSAQANDGSPLQPSDTLLDMSSCLHPKKNARPAALLSRVSDFVDSHPWLAVKDMPAGESFVVETIKNDLNLENKNIIKTLNARREEPRRESPSSLEKMMISPLQWLLDRLQANARLWQPIALSPAISGNVAHKLYELYMTHNDRDTGNVFGEAVAQEAPFLDWPEWRMERNVLFNHLQHALQAFAQWCQKYEWRLLEAEGELQGDSLGLPLRGRVDAILGNGEKVLVLDYKNSKAANFHKRLKTGYDLQTMIYRHLYMGSDNNTRAASGYLSIKESQLVVDDELETQDTLISQATLDIAEAGPSSEAADAVHRRIRELNDGLVRLNAEDDLNIWKQRGFSSLQYWLQDNPLLARHVKPVQEQ